MGRTSSCGLWPLRPPRGSAPPSARCFGRHRLGALSAAVERRRPLRHARHLTRPRYPTRERPDGPFPLCTLIDALIGSRATPPPPLSPLIAKLSQENLLR